jgi:hypothetical protein
MWACKNLLDNNLLKFTKISEIYPFKTYALSQSILPHPLFFLNAAFHC